VPTYIRELVRALSQVVDATLVAVVQADVVESLPPGVVARVLPVAGGFRRAISGLRMPGPADLVHGLDATAPATRQVPRVVTVHDLSVFDVPWTYARRRVVVKRLQTRHAIRAADAIVVPSAFTAERVRSLFGRDAVVIPEAPASDCSPAAPEEIAAVARRYRLPERYVLHVGALEPRKDVAGLARACTAAGVPLVLAGPPPAPAQVAALNARVLGYVPQADLAALYGAATIVAFPSLYEGFGLPPLEAMASGAPVVASRAGSLPEVLGDAALLFPQGDVDELCRALRRLLADNDLRAQLRADGLAHAGRFSWTKTARMTADVYRSLGFGV
jgi:glycosyltransferase involved in cell wall biosynthesis